jgi:uncharacterized lipoprotein YehR (DUF1307 family)
MKNSKLLITFLSVLLVSLSGCNDDGQVRTADNEIKVKCVQGVNYYLFKEASGNRGYGYMAPKYKTNGELSLCH